MKIFYAKGNFISGFIEKVFITKPKYFAQLCFGQSIQILCFIRLLLMCF